MESVFPRLYAILDADVTGQRKLAPLDVLDAWLDAGIRLVQLRAKPLGSGEMLDLADRMHERVSAAGGRLIVNDRADIARMSGAAGVHLGQDDLAVADVRPIVGSDVLIGLSTHTESQVAAALEQPVDYIAIGPVFETRSKGRPADAPVGVAGVTLAARRTAAASIPLVAIGGITLAEARRILDAGASSIAVISDLLSGPDLPGRARAFVDAVA